jgi:hypothetical protein
MTSPVAGYDFSQNIQKMNELLKVSVDTEIDMESKMLKLNVVEKLTGLGDKIDVLV